MGVQDNQVQHSRVQMSEYQLLFKEQAHQNLPGTKRNTWTTEWRTLLSPSTVQGRLLGETGAFQPHRGSPFQSQCPVQGRACTRARLVCSGSYPALSHSLQSGTLWFTLIQISFAESIPISWQSPRNRSLGRRAWLNLQYEPLTVFKTQRCKFCYLTRCHDCYRKFLCVIRVGVWLYVRSWYAYSVRKRWDLVSTQGRKDQKIFGR